MDHNGRIIAFSIGLDFVVPAGERSNFVNRALVLKWFLEETENQKEAFVLQSDYAKNNVALGIPHYGLVEIFNILSRHKIDTKKTEAAFSMIFEFGFQEYPVTLELASISLSLVRKFKGRRDVCNGG